MGGDIKCMANEINTYMHVYMINQIHVYVCCNYMQRTHSLTFSHSPLGGHSLSLLVFIAAREKGFLKCGEVKKEAWKAWKLRYIYISYSFLFSCMLGIHGKWDILVGN